MDEDDDTSSIATDEMAAYVSVRLQVLSINFRAQLFKARLS